MDKNVSSVDDTSLSCAKGDDVFTSRDVEATSCSTDYKSINETGTNSAASESGCALSVVAPEIAPSTSFLSQSRKLLTIDLFYFV